MFGRDTFTHKTCRVLMCASTYNTYTIPFKSLTNGGILYAICGVYIHTNVYIVYIQRQIFGSLVAKLVHFSCAGVQYIRANACANEMEHCGVCV